MWLSGKKATIVSNIRMCYREIGMLILIMYNEKYVINLKFTSSECRVVSEHRSDQLSIAAMMYH